LQIKKEKYGISTNESRPHYSMYIFDYDIFCNFTSEEKPTLFILQVRTKNHLNESCN
jgi:hypothetical protein